MLREITFLKIRREPARAVRSMHRCSGVTPVFGVSDEASIWSPGPERNLKAPPSILSTLSPWSLLEGHWCGNMLLLKGPLFHL